jgi:hypothetical protein
MLHHRSRVPPNYDKTDSLRAGIHLDIRPKILEIIKWTWYKKITIIGTDPHKANIQTIVLIVFYVFPESSSGHHLLTHILMKTKKTSMIRVFGDHFRDRF